MTSVSEYSFKKLAKKDELSFNEALFLVRHYDAKIKEAASLRMSPNMPDASVKMMTRGLSMASLGVTGSTLGTAGAIWVADSFLLATWMTLPMFFITGAGLVLMALENDGGILLKTRVRELLRLKHYQKSTNDAIQKYGFSDEELYKHFYELGEEEYHRSIQKILTRARKAVETVNEGCAGLKVGYTDYFGQEGFVLTRGIMKDLRAFDNYHLEITDFKEVSPGHFTPVIGPSTKGFFVH